MLSAVLDWVLLGDMPSKNCEPIGIATSDTAVPKSAPVPLADESDLIMLSSGEDIDDCIHNLENELYDEPMTTPMKHASESLEVTPEKLHFARAYRG